jgi:hypothetical protein
MKQNYKVYNDISDLPTVSLRPQAFLNSRGEFETSRFLSVVDDRTGKEYAPVTGRYVPVQHSKALNDVEMAIAENPEYGETKRCIRVYGAGAKMVAEYKFPERPVTIDNGDDVIPSITIRNDYGSAWSYSVMFGAFRLICSNGLVIGDIGLRFKRKHTFICNSFNTQMLSKGMHVFSEQKNIWQGWLNDMWTTEKVNDTLKKMDIVPEKTCFNEVTGMHEIGTDMTIANELTVHGVISKWIFYNILSQYITHHVKSITRKVYLEEKIKRLF